MIFSINTTIRFFKALFFTVWLFGVKPVIKTMPIDDDYILNMTRCAAQKCQVMWVSNTKSLTESLSKLRYPYSMMTSWHRNVPLQWRHNERLQLFAKPFVQTHIKKHQGSRQRLLCGGHRSPVDSPHKGPVTRKCLHLMTSWCFRITAFVKADCSQWSRLLTFLLLDRMIPISNLCLLIKSASLPSGHPIFRTQFKLNAVEHWWHGQCDVRLNPFMISQNDERISNKTRWWTFWNRYTRHVSTAEQFVRPSLITLVTELHICIKLRVIVESLSSQWRHNERDGISNHYPHDCLLNGLIKAQIKENIKAPRHWPLWGEFPAQITSNTENVSVQLCHHDIRNIPWFRTH